ncbi:C6 transcription factor [Stagonosporopsis vannaccii]|nr:C6 transcription factor [Stagonosporopsis vannaccii]
MYHWSRNTSNIFTTEISVALQDHIVEEAFRHNFLMKALLGMTSLHLASMANDLETINGHLNVAFHYQDHALAGLRGAISSLSPTNVDAIFLASIMVMVCTIVPPLIQTKADKEHGIQPTTQAILKLMDFLCGIRSILDVGRGWILKGPVRCMLDGWIPLTSTIWCFPLEELRRANRLQACGRRTMVYAQAIDVLERITHEARSAVKWIAHIQPEFFEAVQEEDDLALAIFLLWGVSLYWLGHMWWAQIAGKRLVTDLSSMLTFKGKEWTVVIR